MHVVLVSATFRHQLANLPSMDQRRIKAGLAVLAQDPRTPRPGADIKPLTATDPPKHRLRIGRYRVVYTIEKSTVEVIEVFQRERATRSEP